MRLVSFDPLRTLDITGCRPLKPTDWFRARAEVQSADWVLFPEYWQVNPLVYAWKKRIFPSQNSFHLGHDKICMTRAFEAVCPAHVPDTLVLSNEPGAEEAILARFEFPLVAKTPRSSRGEGVFLVEDRRALRAYLQAHPVAYVQEYLPIDRDLRVVVIGERAVAAYWRRGPEGGFHHNVARGASVDFEGIPAQAVALVESVARELGIDHAGFDVAMVGEHPYLVEFNVRFGNRALTARGLRTAPLIVDYLAARMTPPRAPDSADLPRAG